MKVFASVLTIAFAAITVSAVPIGESTALGSGAELQPTTSGFLPGNTDVPAAPVESGELSDLEDATSFSHEHCDDFGSDSADFEDESDGSDSADDTDDQSAGSNDRREGSRRKSHRGGHKRKGCHPSESMSSLDEESGADGLDDASGSDGIEAPPIPTSSAF
ncbi:hypothetical protein LPJ59_006125 [Coemansia sp. RSA 2399]|nr:hypothetical protein LPJ59_006125 [Coemansia sp. RSA 2399]